MKLKGKLINIALLIVGTVIEEIVVSTLGLRSKPEEKKPEGEQHEQARK